MKTINFIDMSDKISAVQNEYGPRYWDSKKAQNIVAEFWGAATNEHGVIPSIEETIVRVEGCIGKIRFAETSKGYWLIGASANHGSGGFDYAPSVWEKIGYASYHDARLAGIDMLIDFFQKVADEEIPTNRAANQANALTAINLLKAQQTPQLDLFGR